MEVPANQNVSPLRCLIPNNTYHKQTLMSLLSNLPVSQFTSHFFFSRGLRCLHICQVHNSYNGSVRSCEHIFDWNVRFYTLRCLVIFYDFYYYLLHEAVLLKDVTFTSHYSLEWEDSIKDDIMSTHRMSG